MSGALGFFGKQGGVALDFRIGQRPAEGALSELADEFYGTTRVGWFAGEQLAGVVSALECGFGKLQGGGVIGFGEQGRDILRGDLVLEAVDVVFLREAVGGAGLVAQQVSDAEQKKYELGASTSYAVVQHQTDLANARQAEVAAISAYAQAKLQLDQAQGTILENNNVTIDDVKNGRLSKTPSPIPDVAPNTNGRAAATTPGAAPIANR